VSSSSSSHILPKSLAMIVDLTGTSLMTSCPKMKHRTPMLYPVRLGDKDTPIKLMFLEAPPPSLEHYSDNTYLLSAEKQNKHATSFATSQESDSTACSDVGILEAAAEVRKCRPCKGKRNRYKKLVKKLEAQILDNPESFNLEPMSLPPSLQRNDKQREKLMQRMQKFKYSVKMCQETGSP